MKYTGNANVLITGASRGLGRALAFKLGQMGNSVTLVARDEKLLKENVELMNKSTMQSHSYIATDLRDLVKLGSSHPQNQMLIDQLKKTSTLINCAGETSYNLLFSQNEESIKDMITLNLTVPIILTKLAIKPMFRKSIKLSKEKKTNLELPTILNISSILSLTNSTLPGTSVYAATKAGLLGFTTSLAAETKDRIRVNAILPGLIKETDMGSLVSSKHQIEHVSLSTVVDETINLLCASNTSGKCLVIDKTSSILK